MCSAFMRNLILKHIISLKSPFMKQFNLKSTISFVFAAFALILTLSCTKHEFKTRDYADHFNTTSTVTNFVFANGLEAPPTSADDPGSGDGVVNVMGNAHTNFNSHITFATLARTPVHLKSAFPDLAVRFNLPESMVNAIVYDDKGNSIWFRGTGGSAASTSPTTVAFSVQSDIVGGTGKFEGANGKTTSTGKFNLATQTAEYSTVGKIRY